MSRIGLVKKTISQMGIIENYDSSGLVERMEQLVGPN